MLGRSWKQWILDNLLKGVSAAAIHRTLMEQGFTHAAVQPYLGKNLPADFSYPQDAAFFQRLTKPAFVESGSPKVHDHSSATASLFTLDNVLDAQQCQQLCTLIRQHLRPSDISTAAPGSGQSFRTSSTCDLSKVDSAVAQQIDSTIAALFGPRFGAGEPIQAQHYAVGQQFKSHTDYFEPGTQEYQRFARVLGQRTWTCMIYLNTVEAGGATEFERLHQSFVPQRGRAVMWNNLQPDGQVNPATLHRAHPVTKGQKYVITKWFRTS